MGGDWRVDTEKLVEKGTCRKPLPVTSIQRPISIEQKFFKNLKWSNLEKIKTLQDLPGSTDIRTVTSYTPNPYNSMAIMVLEFLCYFFNCFMIE